MKCSQLRLFYEDSVKEALVKMIRGKYRPLFAPEEVQHRIYSLNGEWRNYCTTGSIKATGRTKKGTPVVLYVHAHHPLLNLETLKSLKPDEDEAPISQREFLKLLDMEDGKRVFAVDYGALKGAPSDKMSLSEALKHPQTIPFLGGKDLAEAYLEKYVVRTKYDKNNLISVIHSDDLGKTQTPQARFLFFDTGIECGSLNALEGMNSCGRFYAIDKKCGSYDVPTGKAKLLNSLSRLKGKST